MRKGQRRWAMQPPPPKPVPPRQPAQDLVMDLIRGVDELDDINLSMTVCAALGWTNLHTNIEGDPEGDAPHALAWLSEGGYLPDFTSINADVLPDIQDYLGDFGIYTGLLRHDECWIAMGVDKAGKPIPHTFQQGINPPEVFAKMLCCMFYLGELETLDESEEHDEQLVLDTALGSRDTDPDPGSSSESALVYSGGGPTAGD